MCSAILDVVRDQQSRLALLEFSEVFIADLPILIELVVGDVLSTCVEAQRGDSGGMFANLLIEAFVFGVVHDEHEFGAVLLPFADGAVDGGGAPDVVGVSDVDPHPSLQNLGPESPLRVLSATVPELPVLETPVVFLRFVGVEGCDEGLHQRVKHSVIAQLHIP